MHKSILFLVATVTLAWQSDTLAASRQAVPFAAEPLPLPSVRLTGGPLKHAQDLNAKYLLELEPDRMLAGFRIRAGLEPRAKSYGGWDSVNGKQLTGHIAGHYLSAVSLMYAATGDPRFKERADYIVQELKLVQDKRGNGYLGAITDPKGVDAAEIFERISRGDIRSGGFDLNGMWSPWYTLHKIYAGLRDAYRHTGNATALELEIGFAGWAETILGRMSDAQIQRMLNTEFGAMNEIFADLYADTGSKRWLDLSRQFEHRAITDPLKRHKDQLAGTHGNTQVPKLYGSLTRYIYAGDPSDAYAASFFWDRVVQHHTYATGGHGKDEYFGEPDKLNDRIDGRTAETCNVYNMIKMSRTLFALWPDPHYADFHERALFNHILASQDPEAGWVCYMVPVGRGVQHEYERNMLNGGFTCCVGSSMESHALHADGLFYHRGADQLWVNIYAPAKATWASAGVTLDLETDFPTGESAKLRVSMPAPRHFTLSLRRPFWTTGGFVITVNGTAAPESLVTNTNASSVSSFVHMPRTWKDGDIVEVRFPRSFRLEPLKDNPARAAILWGPLVLAGDLGPEASRDSTPGPVPVFVDAKDPMTRWIEPIPDKPARFRTTGVGEDQDVELVPFYQLHRRTYAIYWDFFTPAEWDKRVVELEAEREKQRKLVATTVGFVQPGQMQAERDANMQGEETEPARLQSRAGRRGKKWFSFDLPVDSAHPMVLVVTYNQDEWQTRHFDLLVDDTKVAEQTIERRGPVRFFDVEYPLPAASLQGKQKVTIKFQAQAGSEVGAVYGIRMIRGEAAR